MILYPAELFNEKFLIRVRDCVLKMPESHPVKVWLKDVADMKPLSKKEQEVRSFLVEVLNSPFNLITDLKMKGRVVGILSELPGETLAEKLLKSYLYLMIGNVTRSDNILKEIIQTSPFENWKGYRIERSLFHKLATENIQQLLSKLSKHPSDRMTYELFNLYIQNYYNDAELLNHVSGYRGEDISQKLGLRYTEKLAPSLVRHLRQKAADNPQGAFSVEQAFWHWPFKDEEPLISENLLSVLQEVEAENQLWLIYLLDNERLSDMYYKKKGKSALTGRRKFLREKLKDKDLFMLSLFKAIEFGDIDQELIGKTVEFLTND